MGGSSTKQSDVDGNGGWADNAPGFGLRKREFGALQPSQPGDR
jgi:hypothetical protein